MGYTLMHQDKKVLDVELNSLNGIEKVLLTHDAERLPIGTVNHRGELDGRILQAWWKNRRIPSSRQGLKDHLERYPDLDPDTLQMKGWGLSLSDHYWMKPQDKEWKWKDINYFHNDFSDDVGDLFFGKSDSLNLDLSSPDNTSDGWLKKRWKISEGKRVLVKAGSSPAFQEPYNEAIATWIMDRLDIDHIPYHVIVDGDFPYSVCDNFVTPETELVSAWYVMQGHRRANHVSLYEYYIAICEQLGVANIRGEIDKMIVVDYLMVNEDRHQNNFGLLRDVETLEFIGVAPIFDTGTALWHDEFTHMMGSTRRLECKPFKNTHEGQLKLVKDFSWLNLDRLAGMADAVHEILSSSPQIDEERRKRIVELLDIRIMKLKQHIENQPVGYDDVDDDVKENVAYSGE